MHTYDSELYLKFINAFTVYSTKFAASGPWNASIQYPDPDQFKFSILSFLGLKRGLKAFSTAMSFFILFVNYFSVLKVPQDQLQQKQKQNCRFMFVDQLQQKYQKVQMYKMQNGEPRVTNGEP